MGLGLPESEEFAARLLATPPDDRDRVYQELEQATGVTAAELRAALDSSASSAYLTERIHVFESGSLQRDRAGLIELVDKVIGAEGSEAETDEWLRVIAANIPAPIGYVTDLIFYSGDTLPDAADVVDKALAYRPHVTVL